MDSTVKKKPMIQPKTMAELLPGLLGIMSKDAVRSLTAKKQPRPTMLQSQSAEKTFKPMTMAEMRTNLLALRPPSSKKIAQPTQKSSTKKRNWNSSVKVENKTISHTGDDQMKHNPVRKVLNFQSQKPKISNRATMVCSETPKFPKPEIRAKKSLMVQNKINVRISGISNIQETPVASNKLVKNRLTIYQRTNKENISYVANVNNKTIVPKIPNHKKVISPQPETSLSNMSFKSNSDASFLEKEKEINDIEMKINAIEEEPTLEDIAKVSPPVSTPFKEYRNVQEFFNNSENDNSVLHNGTIMCFDKTVTNDNKRDESVIVSLCDLLNKAKVTNTNDKNRTELDDLLEVEKQTLHNIQMIENGIKTLNNIKESELKSLQSIRKCINDKRSQKISESEKDKTLLHVQTESCKKDVSPMKSPINRPSVIKVKSPSYKIPKKNLCLRKKVFHKSMPNVSDSFQTPNKNDKALNMYMEMKEKMHFLNTPLVKSRDVPLPDTPAITSHNLQMQLDKLYNNS